MLTSYHRLIHIRLAIDDIPVARHSAPRQYFQHVASSHNAKVHLSESLRHQLNLRVTLLSVALSSIVGSAVPAAIVVIQYML